MASFPQFLALELSNSFSQKLGGSTLPTPQFGALLGPLQNCPSHEQNNPADSVVWYGEKV